MIKSFSCTNFRNVNVSDLKFSRINILIGPNNSGKTNFIKALSFCADMMNCSGSLIGDSAFQTMISKRGMGDLFNKYSDNPTKSIRMKWNIDLTGSKKVEGINMPQRLKSRKCSCHLHSLFLQKLYGSKNLSGLGIYITLSLFRRLL